MRDNFYLFKSALPESVCNNLINKYKQLPSEEGKMFSANLHDHRRSVVRWVNDDFEVIDNLLRLVNSANAVHFNADIQQEMGEMQFGEYSSEYKGKYDWHHDVNWNNAKNFDRKLSVVVQLSNPDDYEGGEFEFFDVNGPSIEDWSNQGSVLVFPSYLTHRVKEVTSGVRYSLVSWIRGPRWR